MATIVEKYWAQMFLIIMKVLKVFKSKQTVLFISFVKSFMFFNNDSNLCKSYVVNFCLIHYSDKNYIYFTLLSTKQNITKIPSL